MKIVVTGTAGFIGSHLARKLLERGDTVLGIDSINTYYDVDLKYSRLKEAGIPENKTTYDRLVTSEKYSKYNFIQLALEDQHNLHKAFESDEFTVVCNLAAQAGVRYSITNPGAYINSNITGFGNILEECRNTKIKHLVYASSSSVYGLNSTMPFSTSRTTDHPVSLSAATKKSHELMAHAYSHLYNIPSTGLRFFTVYGPWGRPDMALFLFTKAILEGKPIDVYNNGNMQRDFTYIDDIVDGIIKVIDNPTTPGTSWNSYYPDPASSSAPYKIYNIGNSAPVQLLDFIAAIENKLGMKAKKNMLPMQPGDVAATWADTSDLEYNLNYKPSTPIDVGIDKFVDWYKEYYKV